MASVNDGPRGLPLKFGQNFVGYNLNLKVDLHNKNLGTKNLLDQNILKECETFYFVSNIYMINYFLVLYVMSILKNDC